MESVDEASSASSDPADGGGERSSTGPTNGMSSLEVPHPRLPRRSSLKSPDPSRRIMPKRKSVSFSTMPSERKVSTTTDCISFMMEGSDLIKVRPGARQYQRHFHLDTHTMEIRWSPTSKKGNKAKLLIEGVKEVRQGKNTECFRAAELAGYYSDACAFSIIYGDSFQTLDLIASSPDEANIWITGVTILLAQRISRQSSDSADSSVVMVEDSANPRDNWLRDVFVRSAGSLKTLAVTQALQLIQKINPAVSLQKTELRLKEILLEVERSTVTLDMFTSVYKDVATWPEIYFLLIRHTGQIHEALTAAEFLSFLETEQNIRLSIEEVEQMIAEHEPTPAGRERNLLTIDGFTAFLLSAACDITDPRHQTVCQDMTQPLSSYFIATSCNTYLLEDQLKGPAGVQGYECTLLKSCRCIEVDVWDGDEGEPVVYHGHTLTGRILFKDVLVTIKTHAFKTTSYPLVLCLENHCSTGQQRRAHAYLTQILGGMLFLEQPEDDALRLPSPADLMNRIILKAKKLPAEVQEEGMVSDENESAEASQMSTNNKRQILIKPLSDLVSWCRAVRFRSYEQLAATKTFELTSLSEVQGMRLAASNPEDWVDHNRSHLSRVYPNPQRVDSSNFNPVDFWNYGCQLVALNYQTVGVAMDLHDGWFQQNASCGYVLKPELLRDPYARFNPASTDEIPGLMTQLLNVKVISGHNFPKPRGSSAKGDITDPYVCVEVFGIPQDCEEARTKTVTNNGFDPLFDQQFDFSLTFPHLALLRFTVLDDDYICDPFIAQFSIPVSALRTGYRRVRLQSATGEVVPQCFLLVYISIMPKPPPAKAPKGGMPKRSSSKLLKEFITLKPTGLKELDDIFKNSQEGLCDAISLRDQTLISLAALHESLGLPIFATTKLCLRTLANQLASADCADSVKVVQRNKELVVEIGAGVPDAVKKSLTSLQLVISDCEALVSAADSLRLKLLKAYTEAEKRYQELEQARVDSTKKKNAKPLDSFSWNVLMLKGLAEQLVELKVSCERHLAEIADACLNKSLKAAEMSRRTPPMVERSSSTETSSESSSQILYL